MTCESFGMPFGQSEIEITIPKGNSVRVLKAMDPVGLRDEIEGTKKALQNPIKTMLLSDIVKSYNSVALIVSDITRPVPSHKLVPCIIEELKKISVSKNKITIIVATGMHRSNNKNELNSMLEKEIVKKMEVFNHNACDKSNLTYIGKTSYGTPLEINSLVAEADVKITTGYIEPHALAGYTGGRKSILPGVSGIDAIRWSHRPENLDNPKVKIGNLNGNPVHQDMIEAAKMVGVDFIVNVVLNSKKEIAKVVAGDLVEAHLEGANFYQRYAGVEVEEPADIVLASTGYPLDRDLYQSFKAVFAAEHFVKEDGVVILLSESKDGIGPPLFSEWMKTTCSTDEMAERIQKEEYQPELDHYHLLSKTLKKCDVIVVSQHLSVKKIGGFLKKAESVKSALKIAFEKKGKKASVIALPYAQRIVPVTGRQYV